MTSSSPIVATTSENHSAPEERTWVDTSNAGSSNMTLAITAPTQPPTTWAACRRARRRVVIVPNSRSTRVTAGLKWAPDTAPNVQMRAISAPVVAAALARSWTAVSSVSRVAMIPEPITAMTRNPVPMASAASRRVQIRCSSPVPTSGWSPRSPDAASSSARIDVGQQQRVASAASAVSAAQPVALEVSQPIVGASSSTV